MSYIARVTFEEARERIGKVLKVRAPRTIAPGNFRRAAVLVPLLDRREGPTVLFTMRTDTVKDHPGQISFPGGRFEAGEDARAAALRESLEEVALDPELVEIGGLLDDQISVSSYVVTPVVGLVGKPPAAFRHQESEVSEPFELPLELLLDRKRFREERWEVDRMPPNAPVDEILRERAKELDYDEKSSSYPVYFFDGGPGREVWGLTARILKDVLDLCFGFSG